LAKTANPFTTTEFKGGSATSGVYLFDPWSNRAMQDGGSTGAGVDPLNLSASVATLLGLQGDATAYAAAAEGSLLTAKGADIEAAAYGVAAGIATENQRGEALAEQVRQVQIMREIDQTIGQQKAATAANGFQMSGSALDIMQSSYQQGYLSQQISGMQSTQVQRGYMEQAAAATGEMEAATVRGDAARLLAEQQSATSATATANAAAMTNALTSLLNGDDEATQLVADLTAGDTEAVLADTLAFNPLGPDQPLPTVASGDPTSTSFRNFG
jgi:hypothetical protein